MLSIYTDGTCEPNPGAGGWAFVVYESSKEIFRNCGGSAQTTNNIMEMIAVIAALEYAAHERVKTTIYSDSEYVVKGCNEWRHKWKKQWPHGAKPKLNRELWIELDALITSAPKAKLVWVRGHSGIKGNERADALALTGRMNSQSQFKNIDEQLRYTI